MKMYYKIIIYAVLVFCTIGYIFSNSIQPVDESKEKSENVTEIISPIVDPDNKIPEEELDKTVRKFAHGIEFSVLGIFLGLLTFEISKKRRQIMISFPLLVALCTAVADEFIQSLNDRGDLVKDILIDFGGALTGLLIVSLIIWLIKKLKLRLSIVRF